MLVIDLRETTSLSDNMLYHLNKTQYLNHPKLSAIIIVGATVFQEMIYRMLIKVLPQLTTPIQFEKHPMKVRNLFE